MKLHGKMKLLWLSAENIKRITTVEITPQGNIVALGGLNKQGKSSCLDAIAYAIGGKKLIPDKPIRTGAEAGKITVKLSPPPGKDQTPLVVTREFTAKGTTSLAVKTDDGYEAPSPQALLDSFVGALTFDPLSLLNAKPKDQVDMARAIVGLDFGELDKERARLYADRTLVNREVAKAEGALKAAPQHADAPDQPVSVNDLMQRLESIQAVNSENEKQRQERDRRQVDVTLAINDSESADRAVAAAREALQLAEERAKDCTKAVTAAQERLVAQDTIVNGLVDQDETPIKAEFAGATDANHKVTDNARRKDLQSELALKRAESGGLTIKIEAVDAQKAKAMRDAAWPVRGMGFDETGLTLNGLPFEQASQAEQLEVSVAMGLATNPTLRVLLIRDGSLIDAGTLATVGQIAARHDAQVWIERCSLGKECQVILTEGHVATDEEVSDLRLKEQAAQQSLFAEPIEKEVANATAN